MLTNLKIISALEKLPEIAKQQVIYQITQYLEKVEGAGLKALENEEFFLSLPLSLIHI